MIPAVDGGSVSAHDWEGEMAWAKPPNCSNGAIDRAGKAIASALWSDDDLHLINAWRSSHGFPLNTFQTNLRYRARRLDASAFIGQRLKRFKTIQAKLVREPKMPLSQVQDIGGCRAVVDSVDAVLALAEMYVEDGHKIQKDYIAAPKDDGYRGIHIVGRYASDSAEHACWNGRRIEIQLRTRLQHAFATAVETVGTFTATPLKFGGGDPQWRRFFALVASAFALREGLPRVPDTPEDEYDLTVELAAVSDELAVLPKLKAWRNITVEQPTREPKATVFLLVLDPSEQKLHIYAYGNSQKAIVDYNDIEHRIRNGEKQLDAVLVRAQSLEELRRAYPNYRADTTAFIEALVQAIPTWR